MTNTATDRATGAVAAVTTAAPGARLGAARVALLVVAAGAWVGTIIWARDTGDGPGTMGLGFGPFVAMWALMMTAMMLPSAVAVARPSASDRKAFSANDGPRRDTGETFVFAAGYLLGPVTL